jgi:hypothetical protein
VGVRALIHLAAVLALAAVAFAFGRWLREPAPGGPLIVLCAVALLCALALRRLYRPGGLGREANGAYRSVGDLVRVAGFGPSRIRGLGGRVRVS